MNEGIQLILDAIVAGMRKERSEKLLTLAGIIDIAKTANGNVYFADGTSPGKPYSYRGYYSDLAFPAVDADISASDFLDVCERALGESFVGYKGGEFVMEASTPLWRAEYGATGEAFSSAFVDPDGDLIIFTQEYEID